MNDVQARIIQGLRDGGWDRIIAEWFRGYQRDGAATLTTEFVTHAVNAYLKVLANDIITALALEDATA